MKPKLKYGIIVLVIIGILLISGCVQESKNESLTCNSPQTKVGNKCCLDNNNNKICDNEERDKIVKDKEKVNPMKEEIVMVEETVSVEEPKCKDECYGNKCVETQYYECERQRDGCRKLVFKGNQFIGKCGVECNINDDCPVGKTCENMKCKQFDVSDRCYEYDYNNFKDRPVVNDYVQLKSKKIPIRIFLRDSSEAEAAHKGLEVIKDGVPVMESFFGHEFQCDQLIVDCGIDGGGPAHGGGGYVYVSCDEGCENNRCHYGVSDKWLMYHEISHTYWSSAYFPTWVAEGIATSSPTFIMGQEYTKEENKKFLGERISEGFNPNEPLAGGTDYTQQSNGGRIFLRELSTIVGKDTLSKMYRDIWSKYKNSGRFVNDTVIEQIIFINTPESQQPEVIRLVKEKLWGETTSCIDSDNGINEQVKGTVVKEGYDISFTDVCEDGKLKEYYCNNVGTPSSMMLSCSLGCSNGVCI